MKKLCGFILLLSLISQPVIAAENNLVPNSFQISSLEVKKSQVLKSETSENDIISLDRKTKNFFSSQIPNLPAYKIEKLSFKPEPDQKKLFMSRFLPEIPQWAIVAGSAAIFAGTIIISRLRTKNNTEPYRINAPDSSPFSIAGRMPGKPKGRFNIEFKF